MTPEYSLYPERPLTLDEYNNLLIKITEIAKDFNNIHLLLSSIAVKTNDNRLLNMVCYVECNQKPNEPKITSICKRWASYPDKCFYEGQFPPFEPFDEINYDVNTRLYKLQSNKAIKQATDLETVPYEKAFVLQGKDIYYIDKNRELILPIIQDANETLIQEFERLINADPRNNNPNLNSYNDEDYLLLKYSYKLDDFISSNFSQSLSDTAKPSNVDNASLTANLKDKFIASNLALFQVNVGKKSYWQGIEICTEHAQYRLPKLADQLITSENEDFLPSKVDHLLTSNSTSPGINKLMPVAENGKMIQVDPLYKINMSNENLSKDKNILNVTNPPFGSDYSVVPTAFEKVLNFSNDYISKLKTHNEKAIDIKINSIIGEEVSSTPKFRANQ